MSHHGLTGLLGVSCAFRKQADPMLFPQMRNITGPLGPVCSDPGGRGDLVCRSDSMVFALRCAYEYGARFYGWPMDRQAEKILLSIILFAEAVPLAFVLIVVLMPTGLAMHLTGPYLTTKEVP